MLAPELDVAAAGGARAKGAAAIRRFDGVVCFGGGDWWYHNRGHYDMQMMREFSRLMPIVHVNSVGVRVPKIGEGKMFFRRISRKLRSLSRGFACPRENFGVLSPVALPGRMGIAVSRRLLVPQVRSAMRKMNIHRPLVWVTCPPMVQLIDSLNPAAVVYQRTDRWEEFPGCDRGAMRGYFERLRHRADLTLFCSTLLYEEEGPGCRSAAYVDHGVDYDRFAAAGNDGFVEAADIAGIAHPRIGFIGGIDSHTFDPPLFTEVARLMPDCHFVLVGGCSLPAGWCTLPNVHLLGQRPYEDVAKYMAACDVLIMPWNQNEWIKACNPVKLKEYLAVGRPVVSTDFAELAQYEGLVRRARDSTSFVEQIRLALLERPNVALMRQRVSSETWETKAQAVLSHLVALGLCAEAAG